MPGNFREIRRRIKGVKNTKQITKTMEMVAASKMRRAQALAVQMRPYAEKALEILNSFMGKTRSVAHPLLKSREVKHTTVILVTSDRGLCGGLNTNVINRALENILPLPKDSISFVTLGKKGRDAMMRLGYKVEADFSGLKQYEYADVAPLISLVLSNYIQAKTDRVVLAYPRYISTLNQKPSLRPLLPLAKENLQAVLEEISGVTSERGPTYRYFEYKFEPDIKGVLSALLPKFIEMQIYKAVLDEQASEHSARMAAMRNATDAAGEIIDSLTFTYNQVRQAEITSEIAEISTAAEVLR